MKCPYCGSLETRVSDKRDTDGGHVTRRRRECLSCSKRFTTYERAEVLDLFVIKKDKRREAFDRQKLKRNLNEGLRKAPNQPGNHRLPNREYRTATHQHA